MAIDWAKARQGLTSNDAYRGTGGGSRPRQLYGGDKGRGGQGNVRRPSFFSQRQPGIGAANVRPRNASWLDSGMHQGKKAASGIYNTGKEAASKFMHPLMMGAKSITNNQAQHDYLDDVYGDAKNTQFWNQAIRNWDTSVDPRTERPGSLQFGKTDTGTSLGQAGKYLSAAGITDNVMQKFMDPSYKFAGNEAWLRSQAQDKEKFDDGMRFIKNAKSTANLARGTQAMEAQANAFDRPSDRQPGLDWDPSMDITADLTDLTDSWTRHDPGADTFAGQIIPKRKPPRDDPGLNEVPGYFGVENEDFYNYPDEKWRNYPTNDNTNYTYQGEFTGDPRGDVASGYYDTGPSSSTTYPWPHISLEFGDEDENRYGDLDQGIGEGFDVNKYLMHKKSKKSPKFNPWWNKAYGN